MRMCSRIIWWISVLGLLVGACLAEVYVAPAIQKVIHNNHSECTARVLVKDVGFKQCDLSPLKHKSFTVEGKDKEAGELYSLSVCQQSNLTQNGGCPNQMFVYERTKGLHADCRGLGNVSMLEMYRGNLSLHIHNLKDNFGEVYIKLQCTGDEGKLECGSTSPLGCTLATGNEFVFKSKYACLGDVPKEAATHLPPNNRDWLKLSPGSIILIAVACVFVTYMVIGVAYGTGKGEKGLDRLPNSDFWHELPILVKDGAIFLFGGCKVRNIPPYNYEYSPLKEDKGTPIADV